MSNEPVRIFIGYDYAESSAFYTLIHSILRHSTVPVEIHPLVLPHMMNAGFTRKREVQSTDFSFTRYMVPYLCNYKGWALFMDCDMLITEDIRKLWELRNDKYTVMVVKHWQDPLEKVKMLGHVQTNYRRKNWTSFMLINCERCTELTIDAVNTREASYLRELNWVDAKDIGDLPETWNHLSGYEDVRGVPAELPCNIHYTLGGPWWEQYRDCMYATLWLKEKEDMLHVDSAS